MSSESYDDALEKYYELKAEYESKRQSQVNRIVRNPSIDNSMKRRKLATLNTKCIICGQSGGTRFYQQDGILIAKCGNATNPCRLDIRIRRERAIPCYEVAAKSYDEIQKIKSEIIGIKMDILFGYLDDAEAVDAFNMKREQLNRDEEQYLSSSEAYLNLIADKDKERELAMDETTLYVAVQNLRERMKEYKETGDLAIINSVTTDYSDVIRPLVTKIRGLKYKYSSVEKDKVDQTFHLIEEQFTNRDAEFTVKGASGKVLAYAISAK